MKATELMIGDWVIFGDEPLKVQHIYNNGYDDVVAEITEESINEYDVCEEIRDVSLVNCSPIPVTPEILEKNGFEMFKYDGWVHYYRIFGNSAIPFVLHSMIGGEMLSREVDIFSTSTDTNCGIEINYVHELQHALRLCGLDELADNFKV